jgi:hypothetical protein
MINTMKNRLHALIVALLMVCMIWALPFTAFGASDKITFSDPSATVGGSVTVNMKVSSTKKLSSVDIMLSYDSGILEFVSGTDAEGGAGAVRIHGDGGTAGSETMSFALQFKALAAGTAKINITSQEIYDTGSQIVAMEHQGSSTVTIGALETASKDATLKSLQVSPGQLTPEFSPEVDTYAVTVGTDVEKLVISAECTDSNATNVVSGNENLQMGENRVSCKVVAQDGETTKEYVIVVTKQEGGASASSGDAAEGFKMHVSERTITVLEPDASVTIPEGFRESTIKIDGHEVKGWVWGASDVPEYCVIYGMNEAGEKDFYRYDMKDTERTIQRYFADPASEGAVTQEVYTQLADNYDQLRSDYNLFRILLIAVIVIALVLLVLLIVAVSGHKNGRGGTPGGRRRNGSYQDEEDYPEETSEEILEEEALEEEEAFAEEGALGEEEAFAEEEALEEEAEEEPVYEEYEEEEPELWEEETEPQDIKEEAASQEPAQPEAAEDDDFEIFDL